MPPVFPVDALEPHLLGLSGRLLLGSAPGRGEWAGSWDLAEDLVSLRDDHRTSRLVCLLEPQEMARLGLEELLAEAARLGLDPVGCPIPDGAAPPNPADMDRIVDTVLAPLRTGQSVFLHCWAGLGRTGTVAACCLIALGRNPAEALAAVRRVRPGAVESYEQVSFLDAYGHHRRPRPLLA